MVNCKENYNFDVVVKGLTKIKPCKMFDLINKFL